MNNVSRQSEILAEQQRRLLTPEQAAMRLGVTKGTLAKHRSAGIGCGYVNLNGRIFYEDPTIDAYINNGRVLPSRAA